MAEAAALEARIARLEAESEIRRLKARYLNACDMKDVEVIRACFHPDAELDYAPMGKFGLDQLIAVFTQIAVGSPIADSHQIHNGEVGILSPDERHLRRRIRQNRRGLAHYVIASHAKADRRRHVAGRRHTDHADDALAVAFLKKRAWSFEYPGPRLQKFFCFFLFTKRSACLL
jgi:hypothetical protein